MAIVFAVAAAIQGAQPDGRASRYVDPFSARQRVVVLTDIANEPDDQMSLVRFLLYSNQFDGPPWATPW